LKTLCTPPARLSRKALSPAAARRCSVASRLSRSSSSTMTKRWCRHRAARSRRAFPPDRAQRRPRRRRCYRQDPRLQGRKLRLQRRNRRVRRHGEDGRNRPGQGHRLALQNAASIAGLMLTTEPSSPTSRKKTRRQPPPEHPALAAWAACTNLSATGFGLCTGPASPARPLPQSRKGALNLGRPFRFDGPLFPNLNPLTCLRLPPLILSVSLKAQTPQGRVRHHARTLAAVLAARRGFL